MKPNIQNLCLIGLRKTDHCITDLIVFNLICNIYLNCTSNTEKMLETPPPYMALSQCSAVRNHSIEFQLPPQKLSKLNKFVDLIF